jgi:hypothetical protein
MVDELGSRRARLTPEARSVARVGAVAGARDAVGHSMIDEIG